MIPLKPLRASLLGLVCLLVLPLGAGAHLLNMTEVQVLAQTDGTIQVTTKIDLSRSMASPSAYYALTQNLSAPEHAPIWEQIGNAIILRNFDQRLGLKFAGASPAAEHPLQDFTDPLIWPRVMVRFTSVNQPAVGEYAISVKLSPDFLFEEPISVAMASEVHDNRLSRWLITEQTSPALRPTQDLLRSSSELTVAEMLIMVREGVLHVIPAGIDHLLFLLGLSLMIVGVGRLVATITLFTVAHCLSLLAASFKIVEIPLTMVELLILATIVWLGVSLVRHAKPRISHGLVFAFGLLHGLGFSSAFLALGITEHVVLQLVAFNLGVELAQVGFILLCVFAARSLKQRVPSPERLNQGVGWSLVLLPLLWAALMFGPSSFPLSR